MGDVGALFEQVNNSKEQYHRNQSFLLRALDYERSKSLCSKPLSPKYSNDELLPSLPVDKFRETTEFWLKEWQRAHVMFMRALNSDPNPKLLALQVLMDPDQKIDLL